jgi:DNA-binding NarL/FixJ family response regulator
MLGALDGFRVVAEVDNDEAAIEAARTQHPHLALIDLELSGCGGWWAIKQIDAEHLADVVVALGRRAPSQADSHTYVQVGTSPRDLLSAVHSALQSAPCDDLAAKAERDLLSDAHAVIEKPTLVDL